MNALMGIPCMMETVSNAHRPLAPSTVLALGAVLELLVPFSPALTVNLWIICIPFCFPGVASCQKDASKSIKTVSALSAALVSIPTTINVTPAMLAVPLALILITVSPVLMGITGRWLTGVFVQPVPMVVLLVIMMKLAPHA